MKRDCEFADSQACLEMLLRAGRALLLFDGLDEVQEAERSRLITELEKLRRRYHGCCMLLTCRTAATGYQFERARYVDVADFTPDQMDAFARRWFGIALRMNSQAATQNPLKRVPINAARGDTVRF